MPERSSSEGGRSKAVVGHRPDVVAPEERRCQARIHRKRASANNNAGAARQGGTFGAAARDDAVVTAGERPRRKTVAANLSESANTASLRRIEYRHNSSPDSRLRHKIRSSKSVTRNEAVRALRVEDRRPDAREARPQQYRQQRGSESERNPPRGGGRSTSREGGGLSRERGVHGRGINNRSNSGEGRSNNRQNRGRSNRIGTASATAPVGPSIQLGAVAVPDRHAAEYEVNRPSRFNENELVRVCSRDVTTGATNNEAGGGIDEESGLNALVCEDRTGKEGRLFGLSKRMLILVSVALVVIIGTAIGGAAASGAFSSGNSGNDTNETEDQNMSTFNTADGIVLLPTCRVVDPSRLGNGVCDLGEYNTEECSWDQGDCMKFNEFKAMYPNCEIGNEAYFGSSFGDEFIGKPSLIGNGRCDGGRYNTEDCGWDYGDCSAIEDWPDCDIPIGSDKIGDGHCDKGLYNTAVCGFDGGDCNRANTDP